MCGHGCSWVFDCDEPFDGVVGVVVDGVAVVDAPVPVVLAAGVALTVVVEPVLGAAAAPAMPAAAPPPASAPATSAALSSWAFCILDLRWSSGCLLRILRRRL